MEVEYDIYDPFDSKSIKIHTFDDSIRSISYRYDLLKDKVKTLEEENNQLREEHYKDKRLKACLDSINELQTMLRGSFTISDDEHSDISQWIEKHKDICKMPSAIGGQFTYLFTPTSIGDLGKIKCNHCGKSYTFRQFR